MRSKDKITGKKVALATAKTLTGSALA